MMTYDYLWPGTRLLTEYSVICSTVARTLTGTVARTLDEQSALRPMTLTCLSWLRVTLAGYGAMHLFDVLWFTIVWQNVRYY